LWSSEASDIYTLQTACRRIRERSGEEWIAVRKHGLWIVSSTNSKGEAATGDSGRDSTGEATVSNGHSTDNNSRSKQQQQTAVATTKESGDEK
jgi:hypothetical protein